MKKETNYSLLIFALLLIAKSESICNNTKEDIWELLGHRLEQPESLPITVCNSTDIQENNPIKLDEYKTFLKIDGEYWREIQFEKLKILYDDSFSLLPELKYLKIMQTDLEEIQPHAFKGLNNLIELSLYRNKLETVPENVFNNLEKLRVLDLSDNYLEHFDDHVFDKLTNLQYLNLGINSLKDISDKWFLKTTNLKILHLNTNKISIIKPVVFKNLGQLEELFLMVDNIEEIQKDAFQGLDNLKSLDIMYNTFNKTIKIDFANELNHLKSLKHISLSKKDFYCDDYKTAMEIFKMRNITSNGEITNYNCVERP